MSETQNKEYSRLCAKGRCLNPVVSPAVECADCREGRIRDKIAVLEVATQEHQEITKQIQELETKRISSNARLINLKQELYEMVPPGTTIISNNKAYSRVMPLTIIYITKLGI